jgi:hypothetical protein
MTIVDDLFIGFYLAIVFVFGVLPLFGQFVLPFIQDWLKTKRRGRQ